MVFILSKQLSTTQPLLLTVEESQLPMLEYLNNIQSSPIYLYIFSLLFVDIFFYLS